MKTLQDACRLLGVSAYKEGKIGQKVDNHGQNSISEHATGVAEGTHRSPQPAPSSPQ